MSKIVKKQHPRIWHTRRNSLYQNKHPSERRGETASDLWKRRIALEASGEQEARTLGETGAPPGRRQVRAGNLNGNSTTSEGKANENQSFYFRSRYAAGRVGRKCRTQNSRTQTLK